MHDAFQALASLWDASLFVLVPRVATAYAVLPWANSYAPLVRADHAWAGILSTVGAPGHSDEQEWLERGPDSSAFYHPPTELIGPEA